MCLSPVLKKKQSLKKSLIVNEIKGTTISGQDNTLSIFQIVQRNKRTP